MDRAAWIITISLFLAGFILLFSRSHLFFSSLFAALITACLTLIAYITLKWIISAFR